MRGYIGMSESLLPGHEWTPGARMEHAERLGVDPAYVVDTRNTNWGVRTTTATLEQFEALLVSQMANRERRRHDAMGMRSPNLAVDRGGPTL